jgi:hypothetical protein
MHGRRGHDYQNNSLAHSPSWVRQAELGVEWFGALDGQGYALQMILIETSARNVGNVSGQFQTSIVHSTPAILPTPVG